MWELRETAEFENKYEELPPDIKERFENQFRKLQDNPYGLGKPLGYPWFRELRNDKFRAYCLIYDQLVTVLFVEVSDKKTQQTAINFIKNNLTFLKETVRKSNKMLIKEEGQSYGMEKELQRLEEERDSLVSKVCHEILLLEGISHE